MKLTEVSNYEGGISCLKNVDNNVWHIDSAGSIFFENEAYADPVEYDETVGNVIYTYIVLVKGSSDFNSLDFEAAERELKPPFWPINIKEIIFEKIV